MLNACGRVPCHRTSSGICPVCTPQTALPLHSYPPVPVFYPPGCICPPTSEQTCQAPMCPRKPIKVSATGRLPSVGNQPMPKQIKEPVFDFSSTDGHVVAILEKRNADEGNVTNLLLLAILRELEAQRKGGKK